MVAGLIEALPHPTTRPEKVISTARGLLDGSLYQTGGVVRQALPPGQRGRIFAHLYQSGAAPQSAGVNWSALAQGQQQLSAGIQSLQGLAVATTALSAINLGVSVVGFAILARKMNQLHASMKELEQQVSAGFDRVEARLSRQEAQLNGIALVLAHAVDGIEGLKDDVASVVRRVDWTKLSTLLASVESLADIESGRRAGMSAGVHAERIRDVRVYLLGVLNETRVDPEAPISATLLHRRALVLALAQSVAAEAYAWRLENETETAMRVLTEVHPRVMQEARTTSIALLGGDVATLGQRELVEEIRTRVDASVPNSVLQTPWALPSDTQAELGIRWADYMAAEPARARRMLADRERSTSRARLGRVLSFPLAEATSTIDGLVGEYDELHRGDIDRGEWEEAQIVEGPAALYIREARAA